MLRIYLINGSVSSVPREVDHGAEHRQSKGDVETSITPRATLAGHHRLPRCTHAVCVLLHSLINRLFYSYTSVLKQIMGQTLSLVRRMSNTE